MPVAILIGVLVLAGGAYELLGGSPDPIADQTPTPSAVALPMSSSTASPTADAIVDWKTYTNTGLGFSIEHPTDNVVQREFNDQYNRLVIFGTSNNDREFFEVRILKHENTGGRLEGLWGAEIVSREEKMGGLVSVKSISKTGYGDAGGQGLPYVAYSTLKDGNVWNLAFYGDAMMSAQELQILSTFKFTSPTSAVPTDWKSFSSKYFTLSFKVPPGFVVTEDQNTITLFYGEPQQGEYGAPANQSAILVRYNATYSKDFAIRNFKQVYLKNFYESVIVVDGRTFPVYSGSAVVSEGGCGGSNALMIPFDLSSFQTCGPSSWNPHMTPDLAKQILSTFRFSK